MVRGHVEVLRIDRQSQAFGSMRKHAAPAISKAARSFMLPEPHLALDDICD